MELDDFKNTWNEIGNQLNEKQSLNIKVLDSFSKKKFQTNLQKIALPEIIGSIICFGGAVFIGFQFNLLSTPFFKIVGVISIFLLILLPAISLFSILLLYKSADINKSYAETLKEFAVQKIKFCKLQKLNFTLSYLLMATLILLVTPLLGKNANTLSDNNFFFLVAFGFGYVVLLSFSKWVFKKYNNIIKQTKELLIELAE